MRSMRTGGRRSRPSARFDASEKKVIRRAAAIREMSSATFIRSVVGAAARQIVEARRERTPGTFEVLCRIDAFADYVAEVEADDPEEAAWLASENHSDYRWEHSFTQEFDARAYVTLDENGREIEATEINEL